MDALLLFVNDGPMMDKPVAFASKEKAHFPIPIVD